MFESVLFVCVGNICRSPLAEGLLKHYAKQCQIAVRVNSAGICALVGDPPQPHSQAVARMHGFDIAQYHAMQISHDMVVSHDLILALDTVVYDALVKAHSFAIGKIKRLGFFHKNIDIADPYQKDRPAFDEMYVHVNDCIKGLIRKLWNQTIG